MIQRILFALRACFKRRAVEEELGEELRFHLDQHIEQYMRSGMSRQAAAREAALAFGGVEQFKEECRDVRGVRLVEALLQNARYGVRLLWKQPGFTAAAVLILALSIGANTAIFSVVDSTLLKPLPFRDPAKLVVVTEENPVSRVHKTGASYPDYRAWAGQSRSLEQIAAYWNVSGDGLVFGGISSPERVRYSIVSNSFFPVLGISPMDGRAFVAADEAPGASKVFLVSHALWERNMGASHNSIGKTFRLDGDSYTLVGVLPSGFSFPQDCDVWLPLGVLTSRQLNDRISHPFWGLGRLKPHTSIGRSQTDMDVISNQLSKAYPGSNANWKARVTPLLDEFTGNIRQSLLVLFGAVLFILLIACASVATLLLARSETRQREFALRAALGAGRGRLICQSLIESLVIVSLSTALALLFGSWGLHAITALNSGSISRAGQFSLNGSMLEFAGVLVIGTTVLIGLSSALQLSGSRFQESLREGPRSGVSPRSRRLRDALVITEVSVTLCLLCGAGLMLSSFRQLRQVDPGFHPERLITMQIALPDAYYPRVQQRTQFLDRLLERLGKSPGIEAAAAVSTLPLTGVTNWESISTADHPVLDWAQAPSVEMRNISPNYFRAMGIRLVRGEAFQEGEASQLSQAVVINQCMADRFWPGKNPIGRRLTTIDEPQHWREVIGVVANVKHFGLDANDDPEIYLPYAWWSSMNLVLRGASDPAHLVTVVRREISALDKNVPIYNVRGMDLVVNRSIASQRLDLY
ncbi:MAG: ABC transporter permease, partial [Bryobacteraceae bacterium]